MAHDSGTALLLMSGIRQCRKCTHRFSNNAYDRFYRTSVFRAFFHLWAIHGQKVLIFMRKALPALERPSSKVLHQTYHRPTLPKRCCLFSVDHVEESLAMEDLEEEGLLDQRIKLMYQDEETVVIVHAITLISVGHDQV